MTTIPRDVLELARIRHWSFTDLQLGDGASLLWLNQRQRHLLLKYRDALRGIVGTSVQLAAVVSGTLVGVTALGVPQYLTQYEDGFAVHLSVGGTPYIDTTEAPVAADPFGQHGGTPGWPLPAGAIALLAITAVYQDGSLGPIEVVEESIRHEAPPRRFPIAFASGNRVIPIRPPTSAATSDLWNAVTAVQLTYIGLTTLAALTDPLTLPDPLLEVLVAGLAELMSTQSKDCTQAERRDFAAAARRAESEIKESAFDVFGDLQSTDVLFTG